MNKNYGYFIDYTQSTIYITKRFAKAASQISSEEFKIIKQLRIDFPNFNIAYKEIEKNNNKRSYNGLSIEEMKRFLIRNYPDDLTLFDNVVSIAETKSSKYATVKKWFLKNYKEAYNAELDNINATENFGAVQGSRILDPTTNSVA